MKITVEFGMGREVHEADSLVITPQVIVTGSRILATPALDDAAQLVWKDPGTGRFIGAITPRKVRQLTADSNRPAGNACTLAFGRLATRGMVRT